VEGNARGFLSGLVLGLADLSRFPESELSGVKKTAENGFGRIEATFSLR